MTKRVIESDLSLAILGLLSLGPLSGYGLRKVFLTTAMRAFSASPGAIYPALRRLEKDGLIEGTVQKTHTLRPRRVFALTKQGRAALVETVTRPVTRDDVVRRVDHLLLRFSFMSGLVGNEKIRRFLDTLAKETEGYLRKLEAELEATGPSMPFSGRAAFEQGVEGFRGIVRMAKKMRAELETAQNGK